MSLCPFLGRCSRRFFCSSSGSDAGREADGPTPRAGEDIFFRPLLLATKATSFLALFLIVGIGALLGLSQCLTGSDTVFVYVDIWEQECRRLLGEYRIIHMSLYTYYLLYFVFIYFHI